ncbi:Hypothetical protein SMAX5B_016327 [Scophthalmus maximus]|uniref:Uncharacterized protein n=1 Tax=Scophthalmus maximus TaxID=52904 RepID=A0A2U9BLC2_SCOMX|nr:Hypothetical protein SMAX5B_016327 [Scophthalmus maximus]
MADWREVTNQRRGASLTDPASKASKLNLWSARVQQLRNGAYSISCIEEVAESCH